MKKDRKPADWSNNGQPVNRLLASLPRADQRRIMPHMETVSLKMGDIAYEADQPIEFAYFPLTGVGSLVTTMKDGSSVEVATIGRARALD